MSMSAVEWKKLGDVVNLSRGVVISKDYLRDNEGIYPVYSSQTANDGVLGRISTYNYDGEFLTWTTDGANAGTVFHRFGKFSITNVCGLIKVKDEAIITYRYLYYWLNLVAKNYVSEGMGNPKLMSNAMGNIIIPLIPIAKQQEIVSHLDTFTTLISNLESELDMRRKQYEHYRNQLLDISDKDSSYIVPFGDICKIIRGNGVQKSDFVDVGVGCIHYGQIYTYYGSYSYTTNRFVSQDVFNKAVKASKGDIIMTDTSENVEDICKSVAYLGDEDIAVSNHSFIIKHNQNPKYLSFCTLTYSFGLQKKKVVFGAKVSSIKQDNLAKINIYLPPIEEQNQIVSKLDTFENLIQSLEQEIKLRKQQYEYYREKLLTFE